MGKDSSIQWTHHTFSPWIGCQRVSPGCQHCYAETFDKRVGGATLPDGTKTLRWGPQAPRVRTSPANWKKPLAWNRAAEKAGVRHRVFCSSLADVFEDRAELVPWRAELFDLIARTPHLDWLLLTKRPQNITPLLRSTLAFFEANRGSFCDAAITLRLWLDGVGNDGTPWPPPYVWLGTTVEDQQRADERIPALLEVPAAVRFVSCEPLLERITLNPWLLSEHGRRHIGAGPGISWVIIGGESGPGARPFELEWARYLVRQCRASDVAPFVKQLGACASDPVNGIAGRSLQVHPDARALISRRLVDPAGGDLNEWPDDLRVREFPSARNH